MFALLGAPREARHASQIGELPRRFPPTLVASRRPHEITTHPGTGYGNW